MRMKSILAVLLILCGLSVEAAERGELLIWVNADKGYNGLQ